MNRMEAAMIDAMMMKRRELGPPDWVRCSIALLQMVRCGTEAGCGSWGQQVDSLQNLPDNLDAILSERFVGTKDLRPFSERLGDEEVVRSR